MRVSAALEGRRILYELRLPPCGLSEMPKFGHLTLFPQRFLTTLRERTREHADHYLSGPLRWLLADQIRLLDTVGSGRSRSLLLDSVPRAPLRLTV